MEIEGIQALAKTAMQLLTKKFYTIPEEGISKLDTIILERLIDDIWDVETMEDIKKCLQ